MTRLTKIPMIAAFSAVIAAFAVTTEASADRGDHRGSHHHRSGDGPSYRGHSNHAPRAYQRQHRPERHVNRGDRRYDRDRHVHNRQWNDNRRGQRMSDRRWDNDRYRNDRHYRDNHRRWDNHRRYDNNRRYDRRHYSYHARPHHHRYDYRRSWRDRDYYWRHRHHYSSWRPYYGPIWGGYRHAYWRDRGCVPVTRYWTWDGRPALVGGIQCYNPYGVAYIVDGDYYPLNYY